MIQSALLRRKGQIVTLSRPYPSRMTIFKASQDLSVSADILTPIAAGQRRAIGVNGHRGTGTQALNPLHGERQELGQFARR